ncbi:cytochrome c oxidase subunit 3 [Paraburkholderia madseniana]|uniref:cytochrome c oxidase subunit 3 n=1 Tax=Paraburkholderia madseniana TaxID=2599607 RepID=UPI0038BD9B0D
MTATLNHPRRLPGAEGVFVFIAADMMVFGLLFAAFVIERGKNLDLFNLCRQTLNFNYGGINTLILLTSSWFVVMAVQAAKANKLRHVPHFIAIGVLCGATFGVLKIVEYTEKMSAGISMLTNDFYMFYFILTGIHLLHVVGGIVVLVILWKKARLGAYNGKNCTGLESGASFWHMVDLLWIFLFPLLYLMK